MDSGTIRAKTNTDRGKPIFLVEDLEIYLSDERYFKETVEDL
jgi:hypothetical protein